MTILLHGVRAPRFLRGAAALLPAVLLLAGLALAGCGGGGVPDLVGMTYQAASRKVKDAGYSLEIDPLQDSSGRQAGKLVVEWQDPKPGTALAPDLEFTVHLKGLADKPAVAKKAEVPPSSAGSGQSQPQSPPTAPAPTPAPTPTPAPAPALVAPLAGTPIYPYTEDGSVSCGHWESGSHDYPYFGAPRDNGRRHAGIDIYPAGGRGTPVRAMKDGTVIKVEPFYTRADGEVTYGLLVDHGDFVANYAEVQPPGLSPGDAVHKGEIIAHVGGTVQLHFEQYAAGTRDWVHGWYGDQPSDLLDPTQLMLSL